MAASSAVCLSMVFFMLALFSSATATPSVYEILQEYGLPSGLLPDSVKNYTLSENGEFQVNLEKPCYVKFEYVVYYEKKITGKLDAGSISGLKGIKVKRLFFLWLDVDEIRVDLPPSDSIYFTVGIINKKLDVGQFQEVHPCRDEPSFRSSLQIPTQVDDTESEQLNSKASD